jgi:hypothetical protein
MNAHINWVDMGYLAVVAVMLVILIIWAGNMDDPNP